PSKPDQPQPQPPQPPAPQPDPRAEAIRQELVEIDRALNRGDLDGADRQLLSAVKRFGADPFRESQRRLADERTKAAAAQANRERAQVRAVIEQFAKAYTAKSK